MQIPGQMGPGRYCQHLAQLCLSQCCQPGSLTHLPTHMGMFCIPQAPEVSTASTGAFSSAGEDRLLMLPAEEQPLLPAHGMDVFGRGALLLTDLKGLDEGPQEGPDTFTPAQQLHQTHHPEQPEKSDGDAGVVIRVLQESTTAGGQRVLKPPGYQGRGSRSWGEEGKRDPTPRHQSRCSCLHTASDCKDVLALFPLALLPPAFPGISPPQAPMFTLLTLG